MATKTKAKKTTNGEREGRLVPKEILIKLTTNQVLDRAERAAGIRQEITEAEERFETASDEFKKVRAEHKSNLKNLTDQLKKLSTEVKSKHATSTEQVLLVINHDAGQAEYWFPAKGPESKIVDTRPLEDAERQLSLIENEAATMPDDGQEVIE